MPMKNPSHSLVKSNPFLVKTASSSLSNYEEVSQKSVSIALNLEALAERVKNAHSQCQASPTGGLISARNAGEWLLEAQGILSHQEWKNWLKIMCDLSENTAKTYMQMALSWPRLQPREETLESAPQSVVNLPVVEVELTETQILALETIEFSSPSQTRALETPELASPTQKVEILETPELASPTQKVEIIDTLEKDQELDAKIPHLKSVELIERTIAPPVINKSPLGTEIQFWLSGNVVPKARPRVTKRGTYLPKQYRGWRNQAEVEIYRQLCDLNLSIELPIPRANISLIFMGNHRKNADLDNLAGACLDALTLNGAGVILDDRVTCVPKLIVEYEPNAKKTGVLIKIEPG
jgi:Holliday junction resolvase RusA-like endonuclease